LFHFDKDIYIPAADIWLDSSRKKEYGFISHAHADHVARHNHIICSPPTADILKIRLKNPDIETLEFNKPQKFGNAWVTLYPAGHILGSAQIKIEADGNLWLSDE